MEGLTRAGEFNNHNMKKSGFLINYILINSYAVAAEAIIYHQIKEDSDMKMFARLFLFYMVALAAVAGCSGKSVVVEEG